MSIDEAITHAEKKAEEQKKQAESYFDTDGFSLNYAVKRIERGEECKKCSAEHRQLAEWLKELKTLREKQTPKKLVWFQTLYRPNHKYRACPACEHRIDYPHTHFCSNCGQAIDWE